MSCYCAATRMPPCGWCEKAYECDVCHKLKNAEEDGMVCDPNGENVCCESCLENAATKIVEDFAYPCGCSITDLMTSGCKCGGG